MTIRVLRVLEYEYTDVEAMSDDMELWYVPSAGVKRPSNRILIRSTTMMPFNTPIAEEADETGEHTAQFERTKAAFLAGKTSRVPRP